MSSPFIRELDPCARADLSVRPRPVAQANSAPALQRPASEKPNPDRILDHKTQAAFLKTLIGYEGSDTSRQLQERLAQVERERRGICRGMLLMVALFILSLAGLGYCALLLPHIFSNPSHFVTRGLIVLGLASLISQFEFFVYLLWHSFAANRLHTECRRRILLVEPQVRAPLHGACQEPGSTSADGTVRPGGEPSLEPLS